MPDPAEVLRVNGPLFAMAAGYLVAEWFATKAAAARGFDAGHARSIAPWAGLAALVIGRLVFIAPDAGAFLRRPVDILIVRSGIDFYGGLVGAALVVAWAARRNRARSRAAFHLLALSVLLGVATQRAGCVLGNHCYGAATGGPLGVHFPGIEGTRYPAEPIEAVLALLLFAALVAVPRDRVRAGCVAAAFLVAYGLIRFGVDFMRVTVESVGPLSESQAGALVMVGVGVVVGARRRSKSGSSDPTKDCGGDESRMERATPGDGPPPS